MPRTPPLVALLVLLMLPAPARAQALPDEPVQDYYKARGRGVAVRWEVSPSPVPVGRDLVATLVVSNVENPAEVIRPDLRVLPAFEGFKVSDAPGPPVSGREVRFVYKLAPRSTALAELPPLRFHYFNPTAAPGKKQFPCTYTDRDGPARITVVEAPKVERAVVPLDAPESLFRLETGPRVLAPGPFVPGLRAWGAVALLGPLVAGAWYAIWRRVFPGAARLARLRRSRAARRALDRIRAARRAADPPAAVASAVLGYLRARFPLPAFAVTPPEIEQALEGSGVMAEHARAVGEVLRACDRARFAPAGAVGPELTESAAALVARLEELA